jgi:hypothetical protein
MVMMTYTRGGNRREITVTSAYLPYDSDEPPPLKRFRKVIDYCSTNKCSSSLDVMPVHTTLYGEVWTGTHEENN